MQNIIDEVSGSVQLPLQQYHRLHNRIKDLRQELQDRDDDNQHVIEEFKRINEAAKLVESFLNTLYIDNPTYIETQITKFNSNVDAGFITLDKENKRITVRLPDDSTRTDNQGS